MSSILDRHTINNSLHRSILSGNRYAKYYKYSACKAAYLEKGTTSVGMQQIAKMAKDFKDESTAIAKAEFSGYDLKATAKKIHSFLYNHFQYDKDGAIQHLKAPYCMWSSRYKGNDCKSYTLNASTILLNLGIKHYLRRTKQSGYYPTIFTHVYVVIPKDQQSGKLHKGYYTVDATVNTMVEQPFLKKDDTYMEEASLQYVGLSAPSCGCSSDNKYHTNQNPIGLSAAYSGQSVTELTKSDYNKAMCQTLARVDDFLAVLAPYTSSDHSSNLLRGKIFDKLWYGHNPVLTFTPKGIYVDKEFVNFSKTFKRLRKAQIGLGNSMPATGDPVTDAALDTILSTVLGGNFFSNTFGAIFANGFELSCWNSTFTPQQTIQEIAAIQAPYFQGLFENIQSAHTVSQLQTRLNFLAKAVYVCRDMYWFLRVNENWRKCSRLALDKFNELFYALVPAFESIVTSLSLNYIITELRQEQTAASWTFEGYNHQWSENTTAMYPVFKVKAKQVVGFPNDSIVDVPDSGDSTNGNPSPKPTAKESSFGGWFMASAIVETLLYASSNTTKKQSIN